MVSCQTKHSNFISVPITVEANSGYQEALKDALSLHQGYLMSESYKITHLSIGFYQDGQHSEVFHLILLF